MTTRKVSFIELEKLLRDGNGVSEIARKMGVTKGTISKAMKRLNQAVTKDVALRSAPDIVDKKLDAMGQLLKVNRSINKELDYIEKTIKTANKEERLQLQDQKIKHVAEIRKQLGLLLDIAQALYNAEEVQAFQQTVLEVISDASPELRHKILSELQQRRAIRSTVAIA
ncbi:MAG: helix-turn-helix domain-containing protein [Desulfobacteraceae bacterium]|nr:MAG: helix-turn-helix domain-containing protein [Desulfobacteraceae bacterium]